MLRAVDLSTGTSLSCSLTPDSTTAQVVTVLKRRGTLTNEDSVVFGVYGIWNDSKHKIRAKRLRPDDRPLILVNHLKRTTGPSPKLLFHREVISTRIVLARANMEESLFLEKGIILDNSSTESDFFSTIQRLGPGDMCGHLFTNITDAVTKKMNSSLRYWVLHGELLWLQPSHEDDTREFVHLANNKISGPWECEFELQTALNVYRLIAPNVTEALEWVQAIQAVIGTVTDNELISLGDVLISDENRSKWKKIENKLNRMTCFDGWIETNSSTNQLIRFARSDGSEYLLLFYLDSKSPGSPPLPILKRFLSLATIPTSLNEIRSEILSLDISNQQTSKLSEIVTRLLSQVKKELEIGMMTRFKQNEKVYEQYLYELPLSFQIENELM